MENNISTWGICKSIEKRRDIGFTGFESSYPMLYGEFPD